MGKDSIANLASAATVAASSFEMKIVDPRSLLDAIDPKEFYMLQELNLDSFSTVTVSEPAPFIFNATDRFVTQATTAEQVNGIFSKTLPSSITGKVQCFEDNIDTDGMLVHLQFQILIEVAKVFYLNE